MPVQRSKLKRKTTVQQPVPIDDTVYRRMLIDKILSNNSWSQDCEMIIDLNKALYEMSLKRLEYLIILIGCKTREAVEKELLHAKVATV